MVLPSRRWNAVEGEVEYGSACAAIRCQVVRKCLSAASSDASSSRSSKHRRSFSAIRRSRSEEEASGSEVRLGVRRDAWPF